jgi:hypothetical protein
MNELKNLKSDDFLALFERYSSDTIPVIAQKRNVSSLGPKAKNLYGYIQVETPSDRIYEKVKIKEYLSARKYTPSKNGKDFVKINKDQLERKIHAITATAQSEKKVNLSTASKISKLNIVPVDEISGIYTKEIKRMANVIDKLKGRIKDKDTSDSTLL